MPTASQHPVEPVDEKGARLRIAILTDAWHPQINGVVTTLTRTAAELERMGHTVELIGPERFRNYPCPGYPDVRLAFLCGPSLRRILEEFQPDAIHLATEGAVGFAARRYCRARGFHYTTSFHSRFPEYLHMRIGLPLSVSYGYLRWFHRRSRRILVATESLGEELRRRGFAPPWALWPRGVDTALFRPRRKDFLPDPRPIFLYAGRVAVEKNVEDFLRLDLPGTRYVVGDGPQRAELQARYPEVRFTGFLTGERFACHLAAADVLVFPSRTDTFGLIALEALACGVAVAAYPVPGPQDVLRDPAVAVLDEDLGGAALRALRLDPRTCRRYALQFSWEAATRQFLASLTPRVPDPLLLQGKPHV
ncbi:MAG TPA: glycosyltransferase family 1 protein [Methylococcus sp.]|nr:glycosyltransferase family 1 protein [Methylococcus sp.]